MQKICRRCIMDTSDPDIVFDKDGFCNHCTKKLTQQAIKPERLEFDDQESELQKIVRMIQSDGKDKPYDCIVGVSGGVDSSYVLSFVKQLGLHPLAIHVDNGWNTSLSEGNIQRMRMSLGVPLETKYLGSPEFYDLQLSFLKSGTPDLEIPTDHALLGTV